MARESDDDQKKTWKKQVKEKTEKIGLKMKDILNQGCGELECEELRKEWGESSQLREGNKTRWKLNCCHSLYYFQPGLFESNYKNTLRKCDITKRVSCSI